MGDLSQGQFLRRVEAVQLANGLNLPAAFRCLAAVLGMTVLSGLTGCSSSPGGDYRGYMTRPYTIRGHRYQPMSVEQALTFEQVGVASYYDESWLWGFVSAKTAIGERIRPWHLQAAHPTLPLPCEVLVESLRTGKTIKVRVNDRGPFTKNRIIDLSESAADRLDMRRKGLERVRIRVLSVGDGKWKRVASAHIPDAAPL